MGAAGSRDLVERHPGQVLGLLVGRREVGPVRDLGQHVGVGPGPVVIDDQVTDVHAVRAEPGLLVRLAQRGLAGRLVWPRAPPGSAQVPPWWVHPARSCSSTSGWAVGSGAAGRWTSSRPAAPYRPQCRSPQAQSTQALGDSGAADMLRI